MYQDEEDYEFSQKARDKHKRMSAAFKCVDCKRNTGGENLGKPALNEYYMVTDHVWKAARMKDGMLCIGCLETRLKRKLNRTDFVMAANPMSPRLADRSRAQPPRTGHNGGPAMSEKKPGAYLQHRPFDSPEAYRKSLHGANFRGTGAYKIKVKQP